MALRCWCTISSPAESRGRSASRVIYGSSPASSAPRRSARATSPHALNASWFASGVALRPDAGGRVQSPVSPASGLAFPAKRAQSGRHAQRAHDQSAKHELLAPRSGHPYDAPHSPKPTLHRRPSSDPGICGPRRWPRPSGAPADQIGNCRKRGGDSTPRLTNTGGAQGVTDVLLTKGTRPQGQARDQCPRAWRQANKVRIGRPVNTATPLSID